MKPSIYFIIFLSIRCISSATKFRKTLPELCPVYKKGPSVNVADLVGSWMTVYTQPEVIDCFVFRIRATTELEREQNVVKYGSFNYRVDWSRCFLQIEIPQGKHFLQGNGTESGLLQNIIIVEDKPGKYRLENITADQWMVFGRRGSEVLIIRDCYGETAAAFARAPYWPKLNDLSAMFHRTGIAVQTHGRSFCKPRGVSNRTSDGIKRKHRKRNVENLNILKY